jgi:hypothetical protein
MFSTKELAALVISNFYSILLYNSEVWHSANLNVVLKQKLLTALANALITLPTNQNISS